MKRDVGIAAHRVDQHGLEVAAMDHPVRRAIALLGVGAEGRASEHAGGLRVHDSQLLGGDHMALQLRAKSERNQNPRCIGRELNAGPDLLQALRLVEHRDTETLLCDRERRSQTPDARPGDDDGARGSHIGGP
jgi:hypothetical protein